MMIEQLANRLLVLGNQYPKRTHAPTSAHGAAHSARQRDVLEVHLLTDSLAQDGVDHRSGESPTLERARRRRIAYPRSRSLEGVERSAAAPTLVLLR